MAPSRCGGKNRVGVEREDDRDHGVIELHLIGYTEDLELLVFDHAPDGEGAFTVPVDPDLLATIEQLLAQRVAAQAETPPHDPAAGAVAPAGVEPQPAAAAVDPPVALRAPEVATHARLSPAEIQTQLRAGRSVRAVARDAGADVEWVERWLAPILAERDRVLREARAATTGTGRGRRPLGAAVERHLAERGVEDGRARWEAARRSDGRWRVTVRFDEEGRARSATWLFDRDDRSLRAQSPLATELCGPRRRGSREPSAGTGR